MSAIGPGDLVVCVDARPSPLVGKRLTEGRVYRTLEVGPPMPTILDWKPHPTVRVAGADAGEVHNGWFCANRFRKLNDDTDDAELIAKIKSCKPIKRRVEA